MRHDRGPVHGCSRVPRAESVPVPALSLLPLAESGCEPRWRSPLPADSAEGKAALPHRKRHAQRRRALPKLVRKQIRKIHLPPAFPAPQIPWSIPWGERFLGCRAPGPAARGNNQRSYERNLSRSVPVAQSQKRIRAHEAEKSVLRSQSGAQTEQRVQRVIGRCRRSWSVNQRNLKARLARNGQPGHCHAILKAGGRALRFERLRPHRS